MAIRIFGIHILTTGEIEQIKFQARIEGRNEEMRITDVQIRKFLRQIHQLKTQVRK